MRSAHTPIRATTILSTIAPRARTPSICHPSPCPSYPLHSSHPLTLTMPRHPCTLKNDRAPKAYPSLEAPSNSSVGRRQDVALSNVAVPRFSPRSITSWIGQSRHVGIYSYPFVRLFLSLSLVPCSRTIANDYRTTSAGRTYYPTVT